MKGEHAKTFWGEIAGTLALQRIGEKKIVARVQKIDTSRWLAVVFYDSPGHGAACVRPTRESAIEWVSETVSSAWPCEPVDPALTPEAFQTEEKQ